MAYYVRERCLRGEPSEAKAMDLCLEAAGKLTVMKQRVEKNFKLLAKRRTSHWTFVVGCLRLSKLISYLTMCLGFFLDCE